jgi:hypothetical protein
MKRPLGTREYSRGLLQAGVWAWLLAISAVSGSAQSAPAERTFPQSKAVIEKAFEKLQPFVSGRLPVLDGFAGAESRPLERFQRAYYQCSIAISLTPSGGSRVRVSAKITAWYADPVPSRSGYQVLSSNGRLESDLLDQLEEALAATTSPAANVTPNSTAPRSITPSSSAAPAIAAPVPMIPDSGRPVSQNPGNQSEPPPTSGTDTEAAEKHQQELTIEAKNLEEILNNQSHPTNLAAIKQTGTPVLASPNVAGDVLFAATSGDEFEILDVNPEWVHVRISGLSRGWIRRSALEMPDDSSAGTHAGATGPAHAEPFRITSQQFVPFPGEWEPLRGKTVKVIAVQKAAENEPNPSPQAKQEFAQELLAKESVEISAPSQGVVLIFDTEDGGMVAATLQALEQWKAGTLSDDAFWHQCFFDPPELLGSPASPSGRQ